jgi:hypothetical protein
MPRDDDFHQAIGRVTANFSSLEIFVAFLVWGFISSDPQIGKTVTAGANFSWLVERLSALVRYRVVDTEMKADLLDLAQRLRGAAERRNAVIHGATYESAEGDMGQLRIRVRRGELEEQENKVTAESLNELANQLNALYHEVGAAVTRLSLTDVWHGDVS